jgi:hypothetical protein
MTKVQLETALERVPDLSQGLHIRREEGMCVMEAVAFVSGEPHSDHPACACPVITSLLQGWNDELPARDRQRLLRPLIVPVVGTALTADVTRRRRFMLFDWVVRELAPLFMRLTPSLSAAADVAAVRQAGRYRTSSKRTKT